MTGQEIAPTRPGRRSRGFAQTDLAVHEAWAELMDRKPRAAALLHRLVANMNKTNVVVVSQKTLAKMSGVSERTIRSAVQVLVAERWISVVRLGATGSVNGYVVDSKVAWSDDRRKMPYSAFTASVVADWEDQNEEELGAGDLRRLPMLAPGWEQLPTGPGQDPPSQPVISGLEPDLPALQDDEPEVSEMIQAQGMGF